MLRHWLISSGWLLLVLLGMSSARADVLALTEPGEIKAGKYLTWFDRDTSLSVDVALDMLLMDLGHAVEPGHPYPNVSYTRSAPWFLLKLDNASGLTHWFVKASAPFTDRLDLYLFDGNLELLDHQWSGALRPVAERDFLHHELVFSVSLPAGNSYLLLRAESRDRITMPVKLYDAESFYLSDTLTYLWQGVLFGTIGILCLYNLLIFFSTRDKSYLSYVLYLGCFGLFLFVQGGMALRWLWPELIHWNVLSLPVLAFCTVAFSILFARYFMQLDRYLPRIDRWLDASFWVMLAAAVVTLFYMDVMTVLTSLVIIPWPLMAIAISLYVWWRGNPVAGYFFIAFLFVGVAAIFYGLMSVGLAPNSWLLDNSLQLSVLLEAALLSFALAHRMNLIKRENEQLQLETQQRLETNVGERTRELQQAMEARSQFLAVMSHEIRTPLNGILGTLDLLHQSPLNDDQKQQARIIENSGNALLRLIDDILDYSRIDAGKLVIDKGRFDLKALAEDCLQLFEQQALLHGNLLTLEHDASLPMHVSGDAMRIRQVIINLISNAIKFTENGSITLIIKPKPDSDQVFFLVKDTGIGVPKGKQAGLFDLFTQADGTTSRKYGGAGLGLAISRRLVLLMGGNIGVESTPGQGSIFWFHLPLPAAGSYEAECGANDLPDQLQGRVLVVDDNYVNLMVAEGICRELGLTVKTCESGAESIAILLHDKEGFDAVLMDCEMPDMDGFETTREIIRLQQAGRIANVPIAALTAHAVPDKIRACHEAGMVMHIAKPVRLEALRKSLAMLLVH